MDPYLEYYNGRLFLAEMLDAAGKSQTDLPTLPKFTHANGHPFLCWNATLGRCTWQDYNFQMDRGHSDCINITGEFANNCINVLAKGILVRMNIGGGGGGLPGKKYKTGEGANPA